MSGGLVGRALFSLSVLIVLFYRDRLGLSELGELGEHDLILLYCQAQLLFAMFVPPLLAHRIAPDPNRGSQASQSLLVSAFVSSASFTAVAAPFVFVLAQSGPIPGSLAVAAYLLADFLFSFAGVVVRGRGTTSQSSVALFYVGLIVVWALFLPWLGLQAGDLSPEGGSRVAFDLSPVSQLAWVFQGVSSVTAFLGLVLGGLAIVLGLSFSINALARGGLGGRAGVVAVWTWVGIAGFVEPRAASAQEILEIKPVLESCFRPGCRLPYRVVVRGGSTPRSVDLEIRSGSDLLSKHPMDLASGEERKIFVYPPSVHCRVGSTVSLTWSGSDEDEDRVGKVSVPISPPLQRLGEQSCLMLWSGDRTMAARVGTELRSLLAARRLPIRLETVFAEPDELPNDQAGYGAVDLVVLVGAAVAPEGSPWATALRGYVLAGGHLVVIGEEDEVPTRLGFLPRGFEATRSVIATTSAEVLSRLSEVVGSINPPSPSVLRDNVDAAVARRCFQAFSRRNQPFVRPALRLSIGWMLIVGLSVFSLRRRGSTTVSLAVLALAMSGSIVTFSFGAWLPDRGVGLCRMSVLRGNFGHRAHPWVEYLELAPHPGDVVILNGCAEGRAIWSDGGDCRGYPPIPEMMRDGVVTLGPFPVDGRGRRTLRVVQRLPRVREGDPGRSDETTVTASPVLDGRILLANRTGRLLVDVRVRWHGIWTHLGRFGDGDAVEIPVDGPGGGGFGTVRGALVGFLEKEGLFDRDDDLVLVGVMAPEGSSDEGGTGRGLVWNGYGDPERGPEVVVFGREQGFP